MYLSPRWPGWSPTRWCFAAMSHSRRRLLMDVLKVYGPATAGHPG
jgi:hypothetical protein